MNLPPRTDRHLLTVVAICYNHADNVARCLESILCQKTDFPFKVIVADDCSTDGSQDVIREYAAKDDRIVPILREKNIRKNTTETLHHVDTQFFHIIETDDYWCDENKLQLQMDALRAHPECIVCGHALEYRDHTGAVIEAHHGRHVKEGWRIDDLYSTQFLHRNTCLFRSDFLRSIPEVNPGILMRDIGFFYYALTLGKVYYIDRVMSVWRCTGKGVWSSLDDERRMAELQESYFKLDRRLDFKFTRKFRHLYLPHEGKKLFSVSLPYFWKGRKLRFSLSKE